MQPRTDVQPTRDRDIGPDVENSHPSPAKSRRECERAELMAAPRRQAHDDRPPISAGCGVERAGKPSGERGARGMLPGDGDEAGGPGITEGGGSRHQPRVDDRLERASTEQLVEGSLDAIAVECGAGRHELLDRVARDDGSWCAAGPTVGDRRCRAVGQGSCRGGWRPAVLDQETHRPQALDRVVVVHPITGGGTRGLDHAVPPFPCARDRRGEPCPRRGFLDRVHGLSNASTA